MYGPQKQRRSESIHNIITCLNTTTGCKCQALAQHASNMSGPKTPIWTIGSDFLSLTRAFYHLFIKSDYQVLTTSCSYSSGALDIWGRSFLTTYSIGFGEFYESQLKKDLELFGSTQDKFDWDLWSCRNHFNKTHTHQHNDFSPFFLDSVKSETLSVRTRINLQNVCTRDWFLIGNVRLISFTNISRWMVIIVHAFVCVGTFQQKAKVLY